MFLSRPQTIYFSFWTVHRAKIFKYLCVQIVPHSYDLLLMLFPMVEFHLLKPGDIC